MVLEMARVPPVIAKNSLGVSRQKVSEESRSRQKPVWITASQGKGRGVTLSASPAAALRGPVASALSDRRKSRSEDRRR